jgi:transmembrane sensor
MRTVALMTRSPPRSGDVEQAAALWYARMASELKTPSDQAAFDSWLAADLSHAEAYSEICAISGRFDALSGHPDMAAFRLEAQLLEERNRRPFAARFRIGLIGAGFAAAAAVASFFVLQAEDVERASWTTVRGEIREIALSDGTHMILGSDTRVDLSFRDDQRLIDIGQGQVFLEVAPDPDRPLVARSGGRTITALGTAFDVRAFQNDLTVTLLHGRVAIARGNGTDAVLDPGQQFRATFGVVSVRDVDADAEVLWRTGVLEFDDIPLSEAVSRFNRSASRTLVLADPSLAELRVSGVFRADDPAGFAAALAPVYPVRVLRQSSGDVVLDRVN